MAHGWHVRTPDADTNPTLPGGVYGEFITATRMAYTVFKNGVTYGILFISDGGAYGLDAVHEFSYDGAVYPEFGDGGVRNWRFHKGAFTKQISPKVVSLVSGNAFQINNHGFAENSFVRGYVRNGAMPGGASSNVRYKVINTTTHAFELADAETGDPVILTSAGSGIISFWQANAGFDDPEQGLPELLPELKNTFSGIAYIEFRLNEQQSNAENEPNADDFRVVGRGRRLMDYDAAGNPVGVVANDPILLSNPALQAIDSAVFDYKKPLSRFNFPSWYLLRNAANVMVWTRGSTKANIIGQGLTGKYYNHPNLGHDLSAVPDFDNATLVKTVLDANINFDWGELIGISGLSQEWCLIRWEGEVTPDYSETYTFSIECDDGCRLYVNGQLIIDHWVVAPGTYTGQIELTAGEAASIKVEYFNGWGYAKCVLRWQSASRSLQVIPTSKLYPADFQTRRIENHTAFAVPTESSEVFERILQRCVGWHWTDRSGEIVFLPPDRPVEFEFSFDAIDDDNVATFTEKTFQKQRRIRATRPNFRLFRYRDIAKAGYAVSYVEGNRPQLRDLANGRPDNEEATDLGVASYSLASRIAELEMVYKSDPEYIYTIGGGRRSLHLTKGSKFKLFYYVTDGNFVAEDFGLVTAIRRVGKEATFTLLPLAFNFYTDEPVV